MSGNPEVTTSAGTGDERPADRPLGPVAAVFIAAGVASLVLGVLTTLSEASESIASALEWSKAVGSLSGKSIITTVVFFGAWAILTAVWRGKSPAPRRVFWIAGILVAVGLLMTFPIFFELFASD
jgi:hypothetical protein